MKRLLASLAALALLGACSTLSTPDTRALGAGSSDMTRMSSHAAGPYAHIYPPGSFRALYGPE